MFKTLMYAILFVLLFLAFYYYLTKQRWENFLLLVFFWLFGFRFASQVKLENLNLMCEPLYYFFLLLIIFIVHYKLPVMFNTRLWQTFFIGGLALEECYRRNFPTSLIFLGIFWFTFSVWWSILGGNPFIYLFVVFFVGFYFQLKQQFFESKLVLEFQEQDKKFLLSCPTGEDIIHVVSFVCARLYGQGIKNRLSSRLSYASFPYTGKRFFSGRPQGGGKTFLEYLASAAGLAFTGLVSYLGVNYHQNREDSRAGKVHIMQQYSQALSEAKQKAQETAKSLHDCFLSQARFRIALGLDQTPCIKYEELLENKADYLFAIKTYEYCSLINNTHINPREMILHWQNSVERCEAIKAFKKHGEGLNWRISEAYDNFVMERIYTILLVNYSNGFTDSSVKGWKEVPSFEILQFSIPEVLGGLQPSPRLGESSSEDSLSENSPSIGPPNLALPSSTRAPSVAQEESFFYFIFLALSRSSST